MLKSASYLLIPSFIVIFFFGFSINLYAQNQVETTVINAELLASIWFSTTTINERDVFTIYAGFQNHSEKNLSGTAGFYVNDTEIAKSSFVANAKSLIKIETKHVASMGKNKVIVKILDIKELGSSRVLETTNLLSASTETKEFNVKQNITKEVLLEKAYDTADLVVNTINNYTEKLADKFESLKETEESEEPVSLVNNLSPNILLSSSTPGKVLGTSTENTKTKDSFSIYNWSMDALAFLVRKWVWILSAIFIYMLYSMFKKD